MIRYAALYKYLSATLQTYNGFGAFSYWVQYTIMALLGTQGRNRGKGSKGQAKMSMVGHCLSEM